MAGSQLKRLKASLREQGLVGPQQSKKQKRKNAQDAQARTEKRLKRSVALEGIREQFNPFQFHTNARGPKFDVTTNKPSGPNASKGIKGRPGVSKSVGEERRRETLLVEMQRRNKVGGILDRRFGEDDPTLAPEEKALHRFATEKQRSHKKSSLFDLEENDSDFNLTHMGKSLSFGNGEGLQDDFDANDLPSENESDLDNINPMRLKRMRGDGSADEQDDEAEQQPERKKTKQEVYKEIIEKSKAHKYERQAAKDADEDLREKIDKDFSNIHSLLFSKASRPRPTEDGAPAAAKLVAGVDKEEFDKAYDVRVKKLLQDKRAQPSERTKTDEEIAAVESARLKELEEKRLKRMRGEADSDDDYDDDDDAKSDIGDVQADATIEGTLRAINGTGDEEDEFRLGKGIKRRPTATELGFDDEDDFIIDDDLVASGSDLDPDEDEDDSDEDVSVASEQGEDSGSEDEFTRGLLNETESKNPEFAESAKSQGANAKDDDDDDGIPYTFPCPQSHAELLKVVKDLPEAKLATVVQRIRALYHPKLDSRNKERLGVFSRVLVQHIAHLGNSSGVVPYAAIEALMRHVHSLAKTFPVEISREFRSHLQVMGKDRPLSLKKGDLLVLTAVGSVFPTSDHFHRVVTPAVLSMARFLGQNIPRTLAEYATGMYLAILGLQFQTLSKRYMPELINFTLNTLCALAPVEREEKLGFFPLHRPAAGIRISDSQGEAVRKLNCNDCEPSDNQAAVSPSSSTKVAILDTAVRVLAAAADCWTGRAAFQETFEPAVSVLRHLGAKACRAHLPAATAREAERVRAHLEAQIRAARLSRRPLELHHHRPLAIRTFVPKFEETFAPDKHYDPDRERAEIAKLKAEHKKERKGAMRELRKDANFLAREKLKAKKVRDEAYERKFKKLVREIQSEEGREANLYEREKQLRRTKKR